MAKRALIIANGRYEDPRFRPLPGAEADLYGLRAVLADPAICGFEVEVVRNGRTDDIRIAIQQFFASARRDDVLLLHVSAHGRRDESRWYFAATNTRHEFLDATGVSFEYIDQRIDRGLSRRVVVLLDCCYSGAATLRRTRGEPVADLSDQFNGRGRVVITSSTALQYAHEQDVTSVTPARPSVFTQAVITGLATGAADLDGDGFVSVDELYDYVHAEVTSRVPEQTPTRTADQVEGRLLLARTPAGEGSHPGDRAHEAAGKLARIRDGNGLAVRETPTPVASVARPPGERAGPTVDRGASSPTVDHSSVGGSPGEDRSPVVAERGSPRLRGQVTPGGYGRAVAVELLAGLACGTLLLAVPMFLISFYDYGLGPVSLVTVLASVTAHLAIRGPLLSHVTVYRSPVLVLATLAAGVLLVLDLSTPWLGYPLLCVVGLLSALRQPVTAGTFRVVGPAVHSFSLLGQVLGAVTVLTVLPASRLLVPSLVALTMYVVAAGLGYPLEGAPAVRGARLTHRSRLLILAAATAEFSWGATLVTMVHYQGVRFGVRAYDDFDSYAPLLWTAGTVGVVSLLVGWLGGVHRAPGLPRGPAEPGRPALVAALAVAGLLGQGILLIAVAGRNEFATDVVLLPGLTLFATLTVRAAGQALADGGGSGLDQSVLTRARGLAGGLTFLLALYPTFVSSVPQEQLVQAGVAIPVEAAFVALVAAPLTVVLLLDRRRSDRGRALVS
ncbi:caspase family protein [Longispora urticae]